MFVSWPKLAHRLDSTLDALGSAYPATVTDLRNSSLFFFLYRLTEREPGAPIVVITETTNRAALMQQFVATVERLVADREPSPSDYLVFPDFEPQNLFEYFEPPVDIIDARNQVLDALGRGTAKIVFTSYKACWRRMVAPEHYYGRELTLAVAAGRSGAASTAGSAATAATSHIRTSIARDELARQLDELGYHAVSTVTSMGEYALRGGLVDVFPVGEDLPCRIDLFGDEIEQLSQFKPETQRTEGQVTQLRILPLSVQLSYLQRPEVLGFLRQRWNSFKELNKRAFSRSTLERLEEVVENDLGRITDGASGPRAGWYYHASASRDHCFWHYLKADTRVVIHEEGFVESETRSYFHFWENRFSDWLRNGLSFLDLSAFYMIPQGDLAEASALLSSGIVPAATAADDPPPAPTAKLRPLFTHAFGTTGDSGFAVSSAGLDNPPTGRWNTTRLVETVKGYAKLKASASGETYLAGAHLIDRPVTVLSQFSKRLRELLSEENLRPEVQNATLPGGFLIPPQQIKLGSTPSYAGTVAQDAEGGGSRQILHTDIEWTVVTDVEVFGELTEVAQATRRRYRHEALRRSEELSPGDFVVHIDYGIGRFAQLTEREVGGVTKSFVEVEYAGRDRLFVPVEQLDRLRRYSFDGTEPQLNGLGREQWKKTREKVKRETLELAKKLLSLYRTRMIREGHAYPDATVWEQEFAEGFPYELTDDQKVAWKEIEADMHAPKPMDRLLVGDVGFGKTELAMRAAFKACVDERQVLILCPTTVLADQHLTTFTRRFRPFPFRVAELSRFQTDKEQKDVVEKLRTGRVDVVIGTHRGLSKDVEFKRLGLLVVDEEQRFGVKQKERMKMRWPEVDVLSMSATPIPRTLHMSLIGLRDISLIETAPVERKPVKTYVGEYDDIMIRESILRELGRGGQVYFLHNRVQDIERIKDKIEAMVPGDKVIVAHGQMKEQRLEEVMHAFSLGAFKIMLATTIIENGLDIPSVNTIVVDNAENLGLAQMHQLRGRVGRSHVQAYAYFFHAPNRILSEEAQNRLRAIYNYAYLGAGYEIAQSDLRIRGAGSLLGEAQSGLAKQVGFEYYCELLARSINDVKELDEAEIEDWEDTPLLSERPSAQIDLPLPSFIPDDYIEDPVLRLEVLRDLAALNNEDALSDFAAELADRFGPPPDEVANLLSVVRMKNLATALGLERLSYNRVQKNFELKFSEGERDWFRRAPLIDGRFSSGGPQLMTLALPFTSPAAAQDLFSTLEELQPLRG